MLTIAGGILIAFLVIAFWRPIVYCIGVALAIIAISYLYNIL